MKEKELLELKERVNKIINKKYPEKVFFPNSFTDDIVDATVSEVSQVFEKDYVSREELRLQLHRLDWMKILKEAVESRPTSWWMKEFTDDKGETYRIPPITEWRNASDEVLWSVEREMEKKKLIEPLFERRIHSCCVKCGRMIVEKEEKENDGMCDECYHKFVVGL